MILVMRKDMGRLFGRWLDMVVIPFIGLSIDYYQFQNCLHCASKPQNTDLVGIVPAKILHIYGLGSQEVSTSVSIGHPPGPPAPRYQQPRTGLVRDIYFS